MLLASRRAQPARGEYKLAAIVTIAKTEATHRPCANAKCAHCEGIAMGLSQ